MITSSIVSVIARSGSYPTALEGTIYVCSLVALSSGGETGLFVGPQPGPPTGWKRRATIERFPIRQAPPRQGMRNRPPFLSGLTSTVLHGFKVTATDFAELSQWIISIYASGAYFFG